MAHESSGKPPQAAVIADGKCPHAFPFKTKGEIELSADVTPVSWPFPN